MEIERSQISSETNETHFSLENDRSLVDSHKKRNQEQDISSHTTKIKKSKKECDQTIYSKVIQLTQSKNSELAKQNVGRVQNAHTSSESLSALNSSIEEQHFECTNKNYEPSPPPFPAIPPHNNHKSWNSVPPAVILKAKKLNKNDVTFTWDIKSSPTKKMARIQFYEIFKYKERQSVSDNKTWTKLCEVQSEKLPMICLLKSFTAGCTYFIGIRAVDEHNRRAPFSYKLIKM